MPKQCPSIRNLYLSPRVNVMIHAIINVMFCDRRHFPAAFTLFLVSFLLTSSAVPFNMEPAEEDESEVIMDRITRVNNAVMETNKNNEVDINKLSDITFYEGDIVINDSQYRHLLPHVSPLTKRASVRQHSYLWTSKIVPYVIDSKIPPSAVDLIKRALEDYENKTCLTFISRTSELNWIYFTRQHGCWSYVGRQMSGAQNISIGYGCESVGIIQHEVMHALGFFHEQSRSDRDSFITIFWENILPGQESNFVRYADNVINTLGLDYDYESVMHYGNRYFSKNGRPTILATPNPEIILGQRSGLSQLDYAKVNVFYDCSFHKSNSWSQWSSYSPCDKYCQKTRQRFCYSHHPGHCDGASPTGIQTEFSHCPYEKCYAAVDGHWGPWSRFTPCSSSCGIGIQRRVRICNDPYPVNGGQPCLGENVVFKRCRIRLCNKGPYDCDFTDNSCSWQQSTSDDFDWTRTSGGTPSMNTGPDWDHTGLISTDDESYGFFLYIEASGKPLGYRARLKSAIIEESGTSDNGYCLSFYYHMFGVGIGELNIYLVLLDGEQTLIWRKYGNQGRKWHHGMVSFVSSLPNQIVFEGVRGQGYTGDTAIDDISILNFRCETKISSSTTNMMQSITKEQPPISTMVPKRLGTIHTVTWSSSITPSYTTFVARHSLHSTPSLFKILPSVAVDCFNVEISLPVSTFSTTLVSSKPTSSIRQTTE